MSTQTIQQILFERIKAVLPNAEVKKIDKDNFLDILPNVTVNKKDVLFFNTKNESTIKLGLTCSDRTLVEKIIATDTSRYISFSGGLKCNHECTVDVAINTALDIISKCGTTINPIVENNDVLQSEEKLVDISTIEMDANSQDAPKQKNPDPGYISNLFQKKDFAGVCYHADLGKEYSNNTFDKILVSAIEIKDEIVVQFCKERYEKIWDRSFLKKQGDFEKFRERWKVLFEENSDLLKPQTEYKGEVNSDNKPHGNGILKYLNSNGVYEGEFLNGLRHGLGKHSWSNGDVYIGNWVDNMRHGKGIMMYANKNMYDGEWYENMKSGNGTMIYAIGEEYRGSWQSDKHNGNGRYKFKDNCIYEGYFKDGKIADKGRYIYSDGTFIEGFFNVNRSGKGKKIFPNGDEYSGEIYEGYMHGIGKMNYGNGDYYEGEWTFDRKEGKSKFLIAQEIEREKIERDYQIYLRTKEEQKESEREENLNSKKEKSTKEQVKDEKGKETKFSITYKIKLKEAKTEATAKGSALGTIFGYDKMRLENKKTNDKGEKIERRIIVKHNNSSMTNSIAVNFVANHDKDVLNGKAGSTTIEIVSTQKI